MTAKPWGGKTVVCIASGPSLNRDDCLSVQSCGLPTVAVNQSWKLALFADVIYAGDPGFWDNYGKDITIPAERWTCMRQASDRYGINLHPSAGAYNSGMRAIQFALWRGAARVLLLGYDVSLRNGLHWHGAHEKTPNPNADRVEKWVRQFEIFAKQYKSADIINCSRQTDLTCFKGMSLEEALLAESASQPARACGTL